MGTSSVQRSCWQTGLHLMGLFVSCNNPLSSLMGKVAESSFLGHKGMFYDYNKGQVGIFVYMWVCVCVCVCMESAETSPSNHYRTLNLPFFPFSRFLFPLLPFFFLPLFPSTSLFSFPSLSFSPSFLEHLLMLNLCQAVEPIDLDSSVLDLDSGALHVLTSNYNPLES